MFEQGQTKLFISRLSFMIITPVLPEMDAAMTFQYGSFHPYQLIDYILLRIGEYANTLIN